VSAKCASADPTRRLLKWKGPDQDLGYRVELARIKADDFISRSGQAILRRS
jgi:hypothetical protein